MSADTRKKAPALKPHTPAQIVSGEREVPHQVCPHCGARIKPLLKHWRPTSADGVQRADCQCPGCRVRFTYTPAQVRIIDGSASH